jgi:hypothetical protein
MGNFLNSTESAAARFRSVLLGLYEMIWEL